MEGWGNKVLGDNSNNNLNNIFEAQKKNHPDSPSKTPEDSVHGRRLYADSFKRDAG